LKILELLEEKKEFAQYDIGKAIGIEYRTVLRHLHSLKNEEPYPCG